MSSDPHDRSQRPDVPANAAQSSEGSRPASPSDQANLSPESNNPVEESSASSSPRRPILIGSQRDPAAYRPKPRRDWIPIVSKHARPKKPPQEPPPAAPPVEAEAAPAPVALPPTPAVEPPAAPPAAAPAPPVEVKAPPASVEPPPAPVAPSPATVEPPPVALPPAPVIEAVPTKPVQIPVPPPVEEGVEDEVAPKLAEAEAAMKRAAPPAGRQPVPRPNLREGLPEDLEDEFQAALGNVALDDLMTTGEAVTAQTSLEADSRHTGRVVAIRRDDVFVELGGREQGVVSLRQFPKPPEPGEAVEVRIVRFLPEEGIYDLALPHSATEVGDWSDIEEGMLVEARVTGHNTGGLECEVNHLRGFIPISQIALYRVEDASQFVGEKFICVVTEANPERRNLVLSRRAVLEREQQEVRDRLWESLEVGQVHEGLVRKLMDFGAFVDIGGVDGLLHVSQLGWARVKHPSEVLQEGQRIQVKIQKIDRETRRLGLSYRELQENPWNQVEYKYPVQTTVRGKVTKLMEFGAFVELEPGIEGLVHISELSHKRVWRTSDVVQEDQEVDVVVLAVDREAQRISLSMKSLLPPEDLKAEKAKDEDLEAPPPPKKPTKPVGPLRGGLGRAAGGDRFGLKW